MLTFKSKVKQMLIDILRYSGALEIQTDSSLEVVTTTFEEQTFAQNFYLTVSRSERLLESDLDQKSTTTTMTKQIVVAPQKLVPIEPDEDKDTDNEIKVKFLLLLSLFFP
jgi:hypothetical protein